MRQVSLVQLNGCADCRIQTPGSQRKERGAGKRAWFSEIGRAQLFMDQGTRAGSSVVGMRSVEASTGRSEVDPKAIRRQSEGVEEQLVACSNST